MVNTFTSKKTGRKETLSLPLYLSFRNRKRRARLGFSLREHQPELDGDE